MSTGDLYSLLGVAPAATTEELKAAYRNAARRFHPDANPDPAAEEEFKLIADAYAILSDTQQRRAYDAALAQAGSGPLMMAHVLFSRSALPALSEPQVLYVLAEVNPSISVALPDPPINLCIVIDRSTSMQGARLDQVKSAVWQVIESLRETDTCSVVAFGDKAEVIVAAERGLLERTVAKAKVSTIQAGGGTEILQGMLAGLSELHRRLSPAVVNHLILLTDGHTYGDEEECLMLASLAAEDGITISGLGIGDEWNDKFIDELTSRTGGITAYISSPEHVQAFIKDRARGLAAAFAERLSLQVTLDPNMRLDSAFRVTPEPGPVTVDQQPLRLGSLPRQGTVSVLLKFMLPPQSPTDGGPRYIARLGFYADVVSLGRSGERATVDVALPVVKEPGPSVPPTAIIEALNRLSQYRLQERASREAFEGDLGAAAQHLEILGTRLLASGQTDLAKLALNEARRLEQTRAYSEGAQKHLKYATRALIMPASTDHLR